MILQSRRTAIEKKLPLDYTEVFNSQHRLKLKICDRNMSLRDIFFKNPLSKRNFNYSCDFEASRLETLPILPPPSLSVSVPLILVISLSPYPSSTLEYLSVLCLCWCSLCLGCLLPFAYLANSNSPLQPQLSPPLGAPLTSSGYVNGQPEHHLPSEEPLLKNGSVM